MITASTAITAPLAVIAPKRPGGVAVWLGSGPPVRSIRWLDGALAAAAQFGTAADAPGGHPPVAVTAIAAGAQPWLELAADRASRAGVASVSVPTELELDYLGWAQIVAAVVRELGATTVLVDEASRVERAPEVAAIAELIDAAQLTHVIAIAPDGAVAHVSRAAGHELQTIRVRGPAVIGVRIAGAPIDEYPTPMPSTSTRRLELVALGLDPIVLGHRALAPRSSAQPKQTVERTAAHLALHVPPRGSR